jgi:endonuclease/exonuclease/phosphatase family metal-dependent hydrolase
VWAVSVHLGLRPVERLRHAEQLSDALRGLGGPIVLGGDLNETPEHAAASFLAERYWDAWLLGGDVAGETFPSSDPTARIDYLFVSEGVRVDRVVVPADEEARLASDHRPLVAELVLPEPG